MSAARTIPGGKYRPLAVVNPASVCCPEAMLATALQSVGVRLHPAMPFKAVQDGERCEWHWLFEAKSQCGTYATQQLIAWWHDAAWLAANAQHEWAIVRRVLMNHADCAAMIRRTVPRIVLRRGDKAAEIPATASDEYRAFIIGQLEGRIPFNEQFKGNLSK